VRIDAHQHYWKLARGDYGWLTPQLQPIYRDFAPADLKPLLAAAHIDQTILVQAAPTDAETLYLLDIARAEPTVAGVIGWADFTGHDIDATIRKLAKDPLLVGLRPMIHDIPDPDWMLRPDIEPAVRAIKSCGLVFDALVKPVHLSRLLTFARRHPDLAIVIDHGAKPDIASGVFEPWAADMTALATCPNVVVKLSGLLTEAGGNPSAARVSTYAAHLLEAFGPWRMLFGSDWPVLNLAGDYPGWLGIVDDVLADLDEPEKAAVMGGNAARLYLNRKDQT
jgi:L-fuconolactonase